MTFIGIDPGNKGAIAWIEQNGRVGVQKMPETIKDLWDFFQDIRKLETAFQARIEQVHSSPQMGVKSAFTFGNGFGHLEMALTGAAIPFIRTRPQEWQKAMKCMTGGDKNVSKRRAQELFPTIKITHANADALLIAEYCKRSHY